ncbi:MULTISPECIES: tetratricopeptide repeat protein [Sphingopyxis]|nr:MULTISPECIES: hypothetical protein [Sphingopyxis]
MSVAAPSAASAADDSNAALNALVRARIAEENSEPAEALSALSALASHAPELPGVRRRMLEQAIEAGDLAAARNAASQLWNEGERRFDAQLVLLVDAMRRSDWAAARGYLRGRSDKSGGDVIAQLIEPSFNAWIDVGARQKMPHRHLLAASGPARTEPALALEGALVRLAVRDTAEALRLIDEIVLTDRTSQVVALRVAATLDQSGQADAAERLRKRIALAAGAREDPLLLLPDQSVATPRAGTALWLALLADGLARTPNANPKVPLLFARAAFWLNDGDWLVRTALVEALAANEQASDALALTAAPRGGTTPRVLAMRRAELLAEAGDFAAALPIAEEAAAQSPRARSLYVRFADLARRAKDADAAARAYAGIEATLGDGDDDMALRATLLVARAELLLEADDWEGAAPLLERAVALRPSDAQILNYAGYSALERRQNVEQSLARIKMAWEQQPTNAAITDSLGWAYFLTGRVDEAVPLLERAQLGEPTNAVIVEHLGDAYWEAGRKFQARYVWRAAALLADADAATRIEAKLRDGLTPATIAP